MEVLKKIQNYRGFDIFWNILDKRKDNLGQECIKGGFYHSRAKLKQLPLISLEKWQFSCFGPTFLPSNSLKSVFLTHTKLHFWSEK